MSPLIHLWNNPLIQTPAWSGLTIALYLAAKRIHRRWGRWWQTPLALTPVLLIGLLLALHSRYSDYHRATAWLITLLGPATVAFAVPIYEYRHLVRRHWPLLGTGMIAGSATALATGWGFATLLGIDGSVRLSLLPRSISTPFAMDMARHIGGMADLAAIFVVLTGIFGTIVGELMINWLPLRSALARGAMLGVAAHAAGTAKAHEIGREEGSVAGLLMILVGMLNVLGASLFSLLG
ncbi:LrgB family protein [Salidesulfovibrio onnuriiensis]|uniref:LrgB family protein n=1 Tax=Salidesulfovibrio onnuriiensis TaxID=2583823 RepID=UPI0011CB0AED|nr:LrgB family protein [Salidesulfovibrio onnuriiensis]